MSMFDFDYCRNGCGRAVGHQEDYCSVYPHCGRSKKPDAPAESVSPAPQPYKCLFCGHEQESNEGNCTPAICGAYAWKPIADPEEATQFPEIVSAAKVRLAKIVGEGGILPQISRVERMHSEYVSLREELQQAKQAIEHDRSIIAGGVSAMKKVLDGRSWLTEGRGSYEWDDDRWHSEFLSAGNEMIAAMEPLKRLASDLSNSPKDGASVIAARIDLKNQLAEARKALENKGNVCHTCNEPMSGDCDKCRKLWES